MERYPAYKDSGVPWLGDVPEHWEVTRTKNIFRLRTEMSGTDHGLELLSIYTHIGVRPRKSLEQKGNRASTTDNYWIVKEGDIIVNKLLAWMGAVGVSHYSGVTSPAYDILKAIQPVNSDYYHHLFRTKLYLQQFKAWSRGIMDMRLRLYFDQFGQIPCIFPPVSEQNQIARYLDWKTSKISKFIRGKKKLIALLKEQKQNIINQAVCKGINPHVRMKDSGVEWLGEIPEHWEVRKLKYIARIKNGKDYREVESSTGYPVIGSGGQFAYASNYLYDGKSVLFGRKGTIDKPLYRDGKFWAVDTMFYTEIYDIVISKFFYYVALTLPFDYYTTKTALPSMTQKDLNNHSIVLPPKIEQQAIVDFIEKETSLIDKTISKAEREIELIQEYRTRLVSDVVTGKIYPQITQINADFDVG